MLQRSPSQNPVEHLVVTRALGEHIRSAVAELLKVRQLRTQSKPERVATKLCKNPGITCTDAISPFH